MPEALIKRALSSDGTEIAGRVHGAGPPLVLLHGRLEDGETASGTLVPQLSGHFTCYTPSTRGRGLSQDNPDHSPTRLIEDVVAFAESVGRPVGMVGWSSGGGLALAAAAASSVVAAVAVYEASASEVLNGQEAARMQADMARVASLEHEGRNADAARAFVEGIAEAEELDAISQDALEAMSRYVPLALTEVRQTHLAGSAAPKPTDASLLGRISTPVLVLHGSQTAQPWLARAAHYIATHVTHAEEREVDGLGHLGPLVRPEPIAAELERFFSKHLAPA